MPGANIVRQTIVAEMAEPSEAQQSRTCVDVKNTGTNTSFTGLLWQPTDKIGVFSSEGTENALFSNTATENAAKTEFGGDMSGTAKYAYFPYSEKNNNKSVTSLVGELLAEQPFNPDNGSLVCDYKVGESVNGSKKFTFKQLFTMLRVTLDASDTDLEGERLEHILLTVTDASGNARNICGDFTFSAADGTWEVGSNLSNSVNMPWTTRPTLTKGKTYEGFLSVMPFVEEDDYLTIEVATEGHKATFTAECKLKFLAGFIYNIPLKLKEFLEKFNGKVETITQPKLSSFGFKVADNTGKLLDNELKWSTSSHTPSFSSVSTLTAEINNDNNEITLTIPYLYDFKLKPTFEVQGATKVLVNGVEQVSGSTEVDFTRPVTYTLINDEGGASDYTVKITNTGLPVVVVKQSTSEKNAGDFDAKTKKIGSILAGGTKTITVNKFVDFMIRHKDAGWVKDDEIIVYKADGTVDCSAWGGVRLRGNTTQDYPKKPFAIKFIEDKQVLGMPAHNRWVLLANWLDHSMIRNTVAFDAAHAIEDAWKANSSIEPGVPWNVHGQHVELVFVESNGEAHHVGNYFLCEQIKIDENRLNISKPYEDGGNGYLFEIDTNLDETFTFETSNGVPFMFKDDVTEAIVTNVQTKIQGIENNINSGNFAAAYENLDINSVIDQWLVLELAMNREYGDPRSVYMFMDGDGKLSGGPVWDFDRGTFQNPDKAGNLCSYVLGGSTDTKYRIKSYNEWLCWRTAENEKFSYVWYKKLITDPIFQETVKKRWEVMKPYLKTVASRILEYGQSLALSYKYDSAMWPTNKEDIRYYKWDFNDWSGDEDISDWNSVISNFVEVYNARLAGMDALITEGKFTK